VTTLVEKVGEARTMKRILEVMTKMFDKNLSEKTTDMIRKISGEGFKSDENMDKICYVWRYDHRHEEDKVAENLKSCYGIAVSGKVRESGKVNAVETKLLRDILEDVDGNPK